MLFDRQFSSNIIQGIAYDRNEEKLFVFFKKNGGVYAYDGVTQKVCDELLRAHSKGTFFHRNIRQAFSFRKLSAEEIAELEARIGSSDLGEWLLNEAPGPTADVFF
jgi:hypothetical protein